MSDLAAPKVVNCYGETVKARCEIQAKGTHMLLRVWPEGPYKVTQHIAPWPDPFPVWFDAKKVRAIDKQGNSLSLLDCCERNLVAAMQEMNIWIKTEGKPIIRKQDRCYWRVPRGTDLRRYLDYHDDHWHAVSGGLHDPWEPGWEQAGSWKTRRGAPDLQVTLWEREGKNVAEVDLDLATGAKHILEAIGNEVSGSLTHPYMVNQLLAVEWGITSFKLEAGQ